VVIATFYTPANPRECLQRLRRRPRS
jgi:hypothetical protein